jgi:hypothetical protein
LRRICQILFLPLLGVVLYLALRPQAPTHTASLLPVWLADWFDAHDNVKNAAGFCVLSWVTLRAFRRDRTWLPRSWRDRLLLGGLLVLIVGLEFAQIRLPGRIPDPSDVVMGLLGLIVAWCLQPRTQ